MRNDGLDEEPLRRLLKQFTYKPNWTFDVYEGILTIRTYAPDTDNPHNIIPVNSVATIPRYMAPDFPWDKWLLRQIMNMEDHEAREFFKINGVKVFDPHG